MDITISLDEKAYDEIAEREIVRNRFWNERLPKMNGKSQLFSAISTDSTHYDRWLTAGTGINGLGYRFVITKKYTAVELDINKLNQEENKKIFDLLIENKENIVQTFGSPLSWQRLDDKKMSRITYVLDRVNVFNEDDWSQIQQFLVDNKIRRSDALRQNTNK